MDLMMFIHWILKQAYLSRLKPGISLCILLQICHRKVCFMLGQRNKYPLCHVYLNTTMSHLSEHCQDQRYKISLQSISNCGSRLKDCFHERKTNSSSNPMPCEDPIYSFIFNATTTAAIGRYCLPVKTAKILHKGCCQILHKGCFQIQTVFSEGWFSLNPDM